MKDERVEMGSHSLEWGKLVCEALGVDPKMVMELAVYARPGDLLTVELTLVPSTETLRECAGQLRGMVEKVELKDDGEALVVHFGW
jgi:hypothetical protein